MSEFKIHTFPNGIRLVHKQVNNSKVSHCGYVFDIGSRDERSDEMGIAHFWEHMAFKGTKRRKAFHIINRLESVGGDLNAYTTKEKVYLYASVMSEHFERSLDLLTDIGFHSVFPAKEIEREKGVILEEMAMYEDAPEEAIVDEFDELVYPGHSLGNNILGTKESVKSFGQKSFSQFLGHNLDTSKIIFASVSNLSFENVLKKVQKYIEPIPASSANNPRNGLLDWKPEIREVHKNIKQAHCMLGRRAYGIHDDKRISFFMLNHLFGGPGMSSRLNMTLREKLGYVYTVESSFLPYVDTGTFSIYFGTEKNQLNRSLKVVKAEMRKLRETKLGKVQLSNVKEQLCGQLAMAEESNVSMMQMMGKSLLDLGYIDDLSSIFERIRGVSASDLCEVANEIFVEDEMNQLLYLPE